MATPQGAPVHAAGTMVLRVRWRKPPPHWAEQDDHMLQAPIMQSMLCSGPVQAVSHEGLPRQGWTSSMTGQTAPLAGGVMTVRVRVLCAMPHAAEHGLKELHCETTQSTGHACVLHDVEADSAPWQLPPWVATDTTERVRDWKPPPQVFAQAPNALQPLTTQFTGHWCTLHCWVSNVGTQLPPYRAWPIKKRVRNCVPVAHSLLHSLQGDHGEVVQSTGHACVLQAADCTRLGQASPPYAALVVISRVRVDSPKPQLNEHGVQSDHAEIWQCTGHGWE
jgi:hypothetical protein